jgi:hypothetical protein
MKPETRHRLLTIALELRLGSRAATLDQPMTFASSRLVEIAEVLEGLVDDDDETAANGNNQPWSNEAGSVAGRSR